MATKRLSLADVKEGMVTAEMVFSEKGRKLVDANVSLTKDMLNLFDKFGVEKVNILIDGQGVPKEEEAQKPVSRGVLVEGGRRISALQSKRAREARTVSISRTKELFQNIKGGGDLDVKAVQDSVENLLDEVIENPQAFASLRNLKEKDEYTYVHSVDVAALSVLFGKNYGLSEEDLKNIAFAAILHDVGKMLVPNEILNKPAKLNDMERAQINKHAFLGYQILKRENVDEEIANCVLEHHERMDGKGYPFGKQGHTLNIKSKMLAICDVYSALTTDRVYRKAMPAHKAIKVLATEIGTHFDQDLARLFQRVIGVYPSGTEVRASDGSVCRVVDQNKDLPMRPVLEVVKKADNKENEEVETIDLSERKDLFIKGIVQAKE